MVRRSFLLSLFFTILVFFYFFQTADSFSAKKDVVLKIEKGERSWLIAEKLAKEDVAPSAPFFFLQLLLRNKVKKIKAGSYFVTEGMTTKEVLEKLTSNRADGILVTIPEGLTLKQIEKKISVSLKRKIDLEGLRVDSYKESYWFLEGVPKGNTLEGFFFPDTYFFNYSASTDSIVRQVLDNFETKTKGMFQKGENIYSLVKMASILEKEVRGEDQKVVADILWRRLEIGMPLQVDASYLYVSGNRETDSPYNTYLYRGLTPTPISNPGIRALRAAQNPQKNNYWYYLNRKDGRIIFNKSLEGHNRAKQEI